jgi:hypothetical protein
MKFHPVYSINKEVHMMNTEQWLPIHEAARLLGVKKDKLARLAREQTIRSRTNPLDKREKLVEVSEIKKLYGME